MTIAECLKLTVRLEGATDSARLDLETLLAWVLKKDRAYLYTWPEKTLTAVEMARFNDALIRRSAGEPIAYIVGEKEFWSLSLSVNNSTLIPRPDTETLVEVALAHLCDGMTALDLGTGSGAIAIAIAHEKPSCKIVAIDSVADAVELAKQNCARFGLSNLTIYQSNWFEKLVGKKFNVIVSNPPYIDKNDPHLHHGDIRYEPLSALVADEDGLAAIRTIAREAVSHLHPNGWLIVEHGWQQAEAARMLLAEYGFAAVKTVKDYGGNDRVTMGNWVP